MARTIPAATQTVLDSNRAEFIIVLEIFWGGDKDGPSLFYSDNKLTGLDSISPTILEMGNVSEAVQVSGGGQASSFRVRLDDTDGTIKGIFNGNDFHKIPVKVWAYVAGTTFATDKFQIFLGQINSPIEWSDGNRDFVFSVVNRIEDVEVGFSAEEGRFPLLPESLIGQAWPLCIGTTVNVPALKAVPSVSGNLAEGVAIVDFTLANRIALAEGLTCPQTPVGLKCTTRVSLGRYKAVCRTAMEEDATCKQAKCFELEKLRLRLAEEEAYESDTITVFGGKNFPQGRAITLDIGGGKFKGSFQGTPSTPSETFKITSRQHPDYDPATNGVVISDAQAAIESACPSEDAAQDSDFIDTEFGPVFTGARTSRIQWQEYRNAPKASFFWAQGGSTVSLDSNNQVIYIANIIPSTIKRVAAYRTLNGVRFLLTVPDEFFTTRQTSMGSQSIMEVVFDRPLSLEQQDTGGGWSDEIFVSQRSSLASNTVTILEWFINTYTDYSIDTISFADVKAKLAVYPMDFALLRRDNLLNILQTLAQRARCALWMKNDTFFIRYLSETPAAVSTITADDILADDQTERSTLKICLTKTEDLVTKHTSTWTNDYSLSEPFKYILRANVKKGDRVKYGTHDREDDYFPYAHLKLVSKSATFWLQRWSNTWKRVKCAVPLSYMLLEPFDAVTLSLPSVADEDVTALVEKVELDSANKQINLELWTPVRAGEMNSYNFAYPAFISQNAAYPPLEAIANNEAGSGNEPNFSTISPPGHPLTTNTTGLFRGAQLACNGNPVARFSTGQCRQDHGDSRPSDIGDTKPSLDIPTDSTGDVSASTSPVTNRAGTGFFSLNADLGEQGDDNEACCGRSRECCSMDNFDPNDETEEDLTRDDLDELPDPDDLDDETYPCQITVTVFGFDTGDIGIGVCGVGTNRTEKYVFDGRGAADEFCASIQELSRCSSSPPCTGCYNCNVVGECSEEDEGPGDLIAFRSSEPTGLSLTALQGG